MSEPMTPMSTARGVASFGKGRRGSEVVASRQEMRKVRPGGAAEGGVGGPDDALMPGRHLPVWGVEGLMGG